MSNSPFPQSDDRLLSYFSSQIMELIFQGDERGKRSDFKIPLILLGLISIICTEPYKVLLRRNIGKLSLSLPRLLLAVLLYGLWATMLYFMCQNEEYIDYKPVFYGGFLFYTLFAIATLIFGIIDYIKADDIYKENPESISKNIYRGDSIFFGYLLKKGITSNKIWMKECMFCFLASLALLLISLMIDPWFMLLTAPLFFTSISFLINETFQIRNVWNIQTKKIAKEQQKTNEQRQQYDSGDGFAEARLD